MDCVAGGGNCDVSPSAAGADIVPIVAGGVAGGLVVLILIA